MNTAPLPEIKHSDGRLTDMGLRADLAKIVVLSVISLFLLCLISARSCVLESVYIKHYPRFFDAINYDIKNVELFLETNRRNHFAVALDEVRSNGRNVFRTVPLLIFYPRLLSKPFGHLATSLPLIFLFSVLLGVDTYRNTRSMWFACAAILTILTVPGLSNPILGYAANWADMPAAMAMGTAVLCLLRFVKNSNLAWLVTFGCFSSVAMTCRWSAAFYLGLYAFPVVLLSFYLYFQRRDGSLVRPLLLLFGSTAPGVLFVLSHLSENRYYYSTFGYALNSSVFDCFASTSTTVFNFLQSPTVIMLSILSALNFTAGIKTRSTDQWCSCLANFWFPLSIITFLCLVIKAAAAPHATLYLVPALFVSAFASESPLLRKPPILAFGIAVIISAAAFCSYWNYYALWTQMSMNPSAAIKQAKLIDTVLADYMAENRKKVYSEYDDERVMATLDCFYKWGWYATPALRNYSVHEAYLKGWYPKETPAQIAASVYEKTGREVDVILIHENINELLNNPLIDNDFSKAISLYMTVHVPKDKQWLKVQDLDGPNGRLSMFVNMSRSP